MAVTFNNKQAELIRSAEYVWFTTVRPDGQPQPTPVWFIQEGDTFLIYSMPDAQKVKNVRANSKVALSYAPDDEASTYVVIFGEAHIDPDAPPAHHNAAYAAKYAAGIPAIGMTPEQMGNTFSTAIRVTPTHARGE